MNTVVLTTFSMEEPALSSMCLRHLRDASVWSSMSPLIILPVVRSMPGMPEMKRKPLALTQGERGTLRARMDSEIIGISRISL